MAIAEFYTVFVLLLLITINSCKKEVISNLKSEAPELNSKPKLTTITYGEMIKSIDHSRIGNLSKYFSKTEVENNVISVSSSDVSEISNLILETDKIKKVVTKNHTSYTLPIKLKKARSQSFENLTIDETKDGTTAFITTYYPDLDWIKRSLFNKELPFYGKVQIRKLNLNGNSSNKIQKTNIEVQSCNSYLIYNDTVDVMCAKNQHSPGEPRCIYTGLRAAYSYDSYRTVTVCVPQEKVDVPSSGGGSTGGGGGGGDGPVTTTNYPFNYNPCPSRDELCVDGNEYISPAYIANLRWGLELDPDQVQWLQGQGARAREIHKYLELTTYQSAPILELATAHLNRMIADPSYLSFVENYKANNSTTTLMWWQNDTWLSNPSNFNLDTDLNNFTGLYDELTAAEKNLVKTHPIDAFIIYLSKFAAQEETNRRFGFDAMNDKTNAFKHAFFNAMNARDCTLSIAKLFSDAHETQVPFKLQKEKIMDLFNNAVGHNIGASSPPFPIQFSNLTLSNLVFDKLTNGDLRYLKPTLPPPLFTNGQPNPNGDIDFWGVGGTYNNQTTTHGITSATILTPTNQ